VLGLLPVERELGETVLVGTDDFHGPAWDWPKR
jgi:hypothetical protein